MTFKFQITKVDNKSNARTSLIQTPHGTIETPAFIFCATKANLKSIDVHQIKKCDTQIILSNTYHLMIQPGHEIIRDAGGIHKFIGWDGPMLTDSGGFQIFSLGHGSVSSEIKGKNRFQNKSLIKINEDGAFFKSYTDGKIHKLTPELSIQIQRDIGADIILVLDECTPYNIDKEYTSRSMEMSHRWATRSINEFEKTSNKNQALYGIVQGGIYDDLRKTSSNFINENNFFGIAIGGTLGGTKKEMYSIVKKTMKHVRKDRPIHLLGIGGLKDIMNGVLCGIDTFDCVHPTRIARHGCALTITNEKHCINLSNAKYKKDYTPIEDKCFCPTCLTVSKAYIHHLIKAKEITAHNLITQHNIFFMNSFMKEIRNAIHSNTICQKIKEWNFNNLEQDLEYF